MKNIRKSLKGAPQLQRGKVIDFLVANEQINLACRFGGSR
jgi:hypothetical protein